MKNLARPLILLILGILTVLLLLRLGEVDISPQTLRQIQPGYLLIAIVIHYSGFVVRGLRWQALLKNLGYRLGYIYTTALLLSGWFISALVPARLGDVARLAILKRDHQVGLAPGLASVATERALDILAILGLTIVAALWALPGRTPVWVWQIVGGGAILFGLALITLLTIPKLEDWLTNLLTWPLYRTTVRFGFELLSHIRQLGQRPGLLLALFLQSLYIWLCDILLMYFAFLSLGELVPLSVTAFTSMVVDLAAAVPLIPGAVGQFEGTALGLLRLFSVPPQQSSLMILLNRFISFWSFIVVSGLITYLFGFAQTINIKTLRQKQILLSEN